MPRRMPITPSAAGVSGALKSSPEREPFPFVHGAVWPRACFSRFCLGTKKRACGELNNSPPARQHVEKALRCLNHRHHRGVKKLYRRMLSIHFLFQSTATCRKRTPARPFDSDSWIRNKPPDHWRHGMFCYPSSA